MKNKRTAVILFNLGGPDSPEAVQPFLFNLFNDKAIIGAPQPIRFLLAKLISTRRAPVAQEIYHHLGDRSPLLENTETQAQALEKELGSDFKCFIAMRYWRPFANETAAAVKKWNPDYVVLLPLYPQFSTTTTQSSFDDWNRAAEKAGLDAPAASICCYSSQKDFVKAHAQSIKPFLGKAIKNGPTRILFTAHGLPEKIVAGGDPYAWQVEKTVAAVVAGLKGENFEHVVCYQSRVGPLKWIGPSTEDEIVRGGRDGMNLVVVPIAFVSEHSETLVELDIEYKALAERNGVKNYIRVPTLDTSPDFIKGLAGLAKDAIKREGLCSSNQTRVCPVNFAKCPCGGKA